MDKRILGMKNRKEFAREIESLTEGGYTFDTFTTAAGTDNISLRLYCVETVIRSGLLSRDINETVRRADTLYRYISNGETDTK